jgi:hypothetical protein
VRAESAQHSGLAAEAPASIASVSKTNLGSAHKMAIQTLLGALQPFLELRGSIPLPYATTFLVVATDEGKGVNAYARAVGIHRAMMSRYLRDIGDRARNGGPGLGLVSVEQHPDDPFRTQVFLTLKGRIIANKVFSQLQRLKRVRH